MLTVATGIALGLTLAIAASGGAAAADDHGFVGAKKCRTCHKKELIGNQYGAWKDGPHAGAFATLQGDKALEYAREAGISGPPSEEEACVKCHVTAYGADPARLPKKGLKASDSVQCESCHGPGADYRKKKIMSDHDTSVAKGLWDPGSDAKICTRCHNDESPAWDPNKYTLADGSKTGFDHTQAMKQIAHPIPEDVKGHYVEIAKKRKAAKRAAGASEDGE